MRALARFAIRLTAVLYLAGLFFDGVGYDAPLRGLPGPIRISLEVAALFPDAAKAISEYRVEAWMCGERRWQEIDYQKYFPLHSDDKESRFQRILHFYHEEIVLKRALDNYVTDRHNNLETYVPGDGIPKKEVVGGARFSILRWPMPKPGDKLTRYSVVPLTEMRPDAQKSIFYEPAKPELTTRCEENRHRQASR
jgi:hypothetical protein